MDRFQIGDRVVCVNNDSDVVDDNDAICVGMYGTVQDILRHDPPIGVEWDDLDPEDGHNLNGNISSHRGYYVYAEAVMHAEEYESDKTYYEPSDINLLF